MSLSLNKLINCFGFPKHKLVVTQIFGLQKVNLNCVKCLTNKAENTEPAELYSVDADEMDVSLEELEAEIARKQNKSQLLPQHRNILQGKPPYNESYASYHNSLKYKRRMFGRYGYSSSLDPGTLWPTKEEVNEILEYERVAYPYSIKEMIAKEMMVKENERLQIQERQIKIMQNVKKLDAWKKEIEDRAAKKLAETSAAKAKKDALIEEVRRHFGFKIDTKDERFKEVLLQKEREQKKKLKAEKAKAREARMLEQVMKAEKDK